MNSAWGELGGANRILRVLPTNVRVQMSCPGIALVSAARVSPSSLRSMRALIATARGLCSTSLTAEPSWLRRREASETTDGFFEKYLPNKKLAARRESPKTNES